MDNLIRDLTNLSNHACLLEKNFITDGINWYAN